MNTASVCGIHQFSPGHWIRLLGSTIAASALAACGGGGGGAQGSGAGPVTMSIAWPRDLSVSTLEIGPVIVVTGEFSTSGEPQTVYVSVSSTGSVIERVDSNVVGSDLVARLYFAMPSELGVGSHSAPVTFSGCYDAQCSRHVKNSPMTWNVELNVTGPDPTGALSLIDISPHSVNSDEQGLALTVIGTGFTESSAILWNDQARPTEFVSATRLVARISRDDISNPASVTISVRRSSAQNDRTAAKMLTIESPSTSATAMQLNPAHSGTIQFDSLTLPPLPLWQVSVPGRPSYPLIADGKVFVIAGTQLLALDRDSGAILWGPVAVPEGSAGTYERGVLFVVGTEDLAFSSTVQALDAATGNPLWKVSPARLRIRSTPTAARGLLYVAGRVGEEARLYAFNQAAGDVAWFRKLAAASTAAVAVGPGGVYASFSCDTYAFLPLNGYDVWSANVGCRGSGGGNVPPVLGGSALYTSESPLSGEHTIRDSQSGIEIGTYDTNSPSVIDAGTAYLFPNGYSSLSAIARETGTVKWEFSDMWGMTQPAVVNDVVFVASLGGTVFGLDANTGYELWRAETGEEIPSSVILMGNNVLTSLTAGNGLLVVPGTQTLTAYEIAPRQ
jgi:outer membrane protein assembly factor BamB